MFLNLKFLCTLLVFLILPMAFFKRHPSGMCWKHFQFYHRCKWSWLIIYSPLQWNYCTFFPAWFLNFHFGVRQDFCLRSLFALILCVYWFFRLTQLYINDGMMRRSMINDPFVTSGHVFKRIISHMIFFSSLQNLVRWYEVRFVKL